MKNLSILIAFILLVQSLAFAQSNAPEKIQKNSLEIGRASSSNNKNIIFDTGDGASNKKIELSTTTKEFSVTSKVNVTGGVSATGAISTTSGNISTASGDLSTASGNISASGSVTAASSNISGTARHQSGTTIGNGANASKSIVMDRAGFDPYLKWDETSQKWVFSNDGTVEKKFGSGSGGDTGITVLLNGSFEDGKNVDWTSSGGTYNSASYGNPPDNDGVYVSFVSTVAGEYFESTLHAIPTPVTGGCLAKIDYFTNDVSNWKVQIYDGSSNLLREDVLVASNWFPSYSPFPCPTSGTTVKVRIISTAAGTILVDHAYLGKENRTFQAHCQGTLACEETYRFRVGNGGVVTDDDYDIVNGNCSLSGTSNENKTCTWNTGIFTVTPLVEVSSCDGTDLNGVDRNVSTTGLTTLKAIFTTRITNNTGTDNGFCVSVTKTGVDLRKAKPQTAIVPEAQAWFIDANIGGGAASVPGAITTYTEITNATFDMVLRPYSASAKIPCATTNPSTGLTCAVGNEGIGVVFTPPQVGLYEVCADFTEGIGASTLDAYTTFQLVRTANSAQTILEEGGTRVFGGDNENGVSNTGYTPFHVCGTFNLTTVAETTIRLMYEKQFASTSTIQATRNTSRGQEDIRIWVRPLLSPYNRPYLVGDLLKAAYLSEQRASGTAAGSSVTSYTARQLNTLDSDASGIIQNPSSFTGTSGTNTQFTLNPGTYEIVGSSTVANTASAAVVNGKLRLQNITDGTTAVVGQPVQTVNSATSASISAPIIGQFTITSAKTFELQMRNNVATTSGWGFAAGYGDNEIYTQIKITKVK